MRPRRALGLLALCAPLAAAALAAGPRASEHRAPEGGAAATDEDARREVLAELWQRRIVSADFTQYGEQDLALLSRMRAAERAGAIALLRRSYHGLQGLAVADKRPGDLAPRYRLTKDGFDKYLFLRSQQAIRYFQSRDVEAKWAFQLSDEDGRKLFTPDGLLSAQGEALYARVAAGLAAKWKLPDGTLQSNKPMRPEAPSKPAVAERPEDKLEAPHEGLEMTVHDATPPPPPQAPPSQGPAAPPDAGPQQGTPPPPADTQTAAPPPQSSAPPPQSNSAGPAPSDDGQ